jgi:hypothetical protein
MTTAQVPGLVSVVIPTHNRAGLIGETLDSVLRQTYPHVEAVVVDDGSTDGTDKVVADCIERNGRERIRYFRQEHAGGQRARNRGMAEAKGGFLQFLDSDDLLHAEKLARQVEVLNSRADLDFVVGTVVDFVDAGNLLTPPPSGSGPAVSLAGFFSGTAFLIHAPLFRRSSLQKVGKWDESLPCAQETNYFGRVLAAGLRGEFLTEAVCYRRVHVSRLRSSVTGLDRLTGQFLALKGVRTEALRHGTDLPAGVALGTELLGCRVLAARGDTAGALACLEEARRIQRARDGRLSAGLVCRWWLLRATGSLGYSLPWRLWNWVVRLARQG